MLPKLGKKTSEATGYCKRTVEQSIAEEKIRRSRIYFTMRSGIRRADYEYIVVDDFDCDAIRRILFMNFMPRRNTPL